MLSIVTGEISEGDKYPVPVFRQVNVGRFLAAAGIEMNALGAADWAIFSGYLVVILGLGLWFARGQHTSEEYFVGGRRMNWLAVGISLFATAFSAISFVAYPREGAYEGFYFFLVILFIPLVITPILWWVFVPLYVRLGVTSIYEYLEIRFSRSMRRLGTVLFAGYAIGWMGNMLYTVGIIIVAVMGLEEAHLKWILIGVGLFAMAYTALGGFKAVVWTDVLQTLTLGGGVLLVFLLALQQIDGGWNTVVALGAEHDRFRMFKMDFNLDDRSTFYSVCAFALFMYLPGYTTSQVTAQRYVCMSSLGEARRALFIHAVTLTLVCLLFFLVGTTLFAYYHQPGASGFPELAKQDQIMPHFVAKELRVAGLTGLLLAGLFAAAMSTMDSGINSLTAVVAYDWLAGRTLRVGWSRLLCVAFGVCVIGAALLCPHLGENVIGIITRISGTFLGLLLGVFLLGMFVPHANAPGALVGLAVGIACLAIVWGWTEIPHWWYGAFTCLPTFAVGVLASYAFPQPRPEQMKGLVFGNEKR